jgi:hypothetical protein
VVEEKVKRPCLLNESRFHPIFFKDKKCYDVEVPTINYHLKKVFEDSELEEDSVIRNFRITAADGKTCDTKHYNLSAAGLAPGGSR